MMKFVWNWFFFNSQK